MKRFIWTIAMAIAGFGLGWNGQGVSYDRRRVVLATIWAAGIGLGSEASLTNRGLPTPHWFFIGFSLWAAGVLLSPVVPLALVASTGGRCWNCWSTIGGTDRLCPCEIHA